MISLSGTTKYAGLGEYNVNTQLYLAYVFKEKETGKRDTKKKRRKR
jgi:hypothetical protein